MVTYWPFLQVRFIYPTIYPTIYWYLLDLSTPYMNTVSLGVSQLTMNFGFFYRMCIVFCLWLLRTWVPNGVPYSPWMDSFWSHSSWKLYPFCWFLWRLWLCWINWSSTAMMVPNKVIHNTIIPLSADKTLDKQLTFE